MTDGPELVAWERVPPTSGHSVLRVARTATGWRFEAAEVFEDGPVRCACWYMVEVDTTWRTRHATIDVLTVDGTRQVRLDVDAEATWRVDGLERPDLAGCLDVDVASAPVTNTFPIRRHADLARGEAPDAAGGLGRGAGPHGDAGRAGLHPRTRAGGRR